MHYTMLVNSHEYRHARGIQRAGMVVSHDEGDLIAYETFIRGEGLAECTWVPIAHWLEARCDSQKGAVAL